jgi:microcystin-dependent protein
MKTHPAILCAVLLLAAAQLPAPADPLGVPEYVNYQGLLKAADGAPLATGNYTLEFNVYDQANLGNKVWGPFRFDGGVGVGHGLLVPVVNGSFNVIIGPGDTDGDSITAAFAGPNRFIEMSVDGGAPILPRQQFLSTAYALQCQTAQVAEVAASLVADLTNALCPPGSIMAFAGSTIPAGWLVCDGSAVASTAKARLFSVIGTIWGDGSTHLGTVETPANPATDFNLPDLRGLFLRGINGARSDTSADPDAATRTFSAAGGNTGNQVGSLQTDKVQAHSHQWGYYNSTDLFAWNSAEQAVKALDRLVSDQIPSGSGKDDDFMNVMNEAGGFWTQPVAPIPVNDATAETRPNNAYVNYIIKD